jgi:hypothetical protein
MSAHILSSRGLSGTFGMSRSGCPGGKSLFSLTPAPGVYIRSAHCGGGIGQDMTIPKRSPSIHAYPKRARKRPAAPRDWRSTSVLAEEMILVNLIVILSHERECGPPRYARVTRIAAGRPGRTFAAVKAQDTRTGRTSSPRIIRLGRQRSSAGSTSRRSLGKRPNRRLSTIWPSSSARGAPRQR